MSIPLVQEATKDDINTSIIAIKRNIERINMLLGLVDSGSDPDLSGFATKQELQDAITELSPVDEVTVDNMHSVTSNAVAKSFSYSTTEIDTGTVWLDGKKRYKRTFVYENIINSSPSTEMKIDSNFPLSNSQIVKVEMYAYKPSSQLFTTNLILRTANNAGSDLYATIGTGSGVFTLYATFYYTKTT